MLIWMGAGLCFGQPRLEIPLADSPARGPAEALVTMVEFIDFQ
jgi:hypothetical protein